MTNKVVSKSEFLKFDPEKRVVGYALTSGVDYWDGNILASFFGARVREVVEVVRNAAEKQGVEWVDVVLQELEQLPDERIEFARVIFHNQEKCTLIIQSSPTNVITHKHFKLKDPILVVADVPAGEQMWAIAKSFKARPREPLYYELEVHVHSVADINFK